MSNEEKIDKIISDEKDKKETKPEEAKKPVSINDPNEQIRLLGKGKMTLAVPIRGRGKDISELHFDFTALTGWEYAEAMDADANTGNIFRISNRQALALFALSASKFTTVKNDAGEDERALDAIDIKQRLGAQDAVKAVQLATVFFSASTRAGNNRITNA